MRRMRAVVSFASVFVFRRAVGRVGNCWAKMPALTGISHPKPSRDAKARNDEGREKAAHHEKEEAPTVGLEPTTRRLTAACSTN